MKTKRLVKVQVLTVIALMGYAMFAFYLFQSVMSNQPMASSMSLANEEIKTADLPRIQNDLREVVSTLAAFRDRTNELFLLCFFTTISAVVLFAWNLFVISRVKREVNQAA